MINWNQHTDDVPVLQKEWIWMEKCFVAVWNIDKLALFWVMQFGEICWHLIEVTHPGHNDGSFMVCRGKSGVRRTRNKWYSLPAPPADVWRIIFLDEYIKGFVHYTLYIIINTPVLTHYTKTLIFRNNTSCAEVTYWGPTKRASFRRWHFWHEFDSECFCLLCE